MHLETGETLVPRDVLRRVLSVMASCGMYDGAGHWMTEVGLPAKSGVSGGIMAILPQQFGVGTYAPPLNENGNSVRGVAMCRELSQHYGLHVFEPRMGRLHTSRVEEKAVDGAQVVRFVVQGDLHGVGTEALLWRIVREPPTTRVVIVDLRTADQVTAYARQALRGWSPGSPPTVASCGSTIRTGCCSITEPSRCGRARSPEQIALPGHGPPTPGPRPRASRTRAAGASSRSTR